MQRFLVTGGCGFIGSHLVDHIAMLGHEVVNIDNLSTGKIANIEQSRRSISCIHSAVEHTALNELGHFDCVFHLAAQSSVPLSISRFYDSSLANIASSLRVIDYCISSQTPLVYTSSSAVYGDLSFGEEIGPVDLTSPYAVDKFSTELYCKVANRIHGMNSFGARFFNVYGPRQDPDNPYSGVIPIFANRILNNQPIFINGGYQTRDFVYVSDAVQSLWKSYHLLVRQPGAHYSNVLTGVSTSIDDLATELSALIGNDVPRYYRDLPPGDPAVSIGSTERMCSSLNITNFVELKVGLAHVLKWMTR